VRSLETLNPELELIDSRVIVPCKELQDICKRIRKTIVKRDHKVRIWSVKCTRLGKGWTSSSAGCDTIQLVDFDRHNNSLNKLREKKEKSLSDEKNLFKVGLPTVPAKGVAVTWSLTSDTDDTEQVEQDFEIASNEYEHWNTLVKQELPHFFQLSTSFIEPIFHSFYYMQYVAFVLS
jgi:amphiphysin